MKINALHIQCINEYMCKHGMTQQALAAQLGIAQSAVNYWLTGSTLTIRNSNWVKLTRLIPKLAATKSNDELLQTGEEIKQKITVLGLRKEYVDEIETSIDIIMNDSSISAEKRVMLYGKLKKVADFLAQNMKDGGTDNGDKEA